MAEGKGESMNNREHNEPNYLTLRQLQKHFETKRFDSSTSIAITSSAPRCAQAIRACGISGFPGLCWKRIS